MSTFIRRADISESDAIAALFRHTRKISLPFLPILHTPEEDRTFFRERIFPNYELWVADDGALAGFIVFHDTWVEHLYIHPLSQRKGYGRLLLSRAKHSNVMLSLWTFQKNTDAARFYISQQFALVKSTDGAENEEKEPDALYEWRP